MSSFCAKIIAVASYLPLDRLTNADLEARLDTSDEWIITRTGIAERRVASQEESASEMGARAAEKLFAKSAIPKEKIDFILVATMTPDYKTPSTAALIQHRLGLGPIPAFDLNAACSGYPYALTLAKGLIESALYRNILVIATEKMSSIVDANDRNTAILFGDGASATLVSGDGDEGLEILKPALGSDGSKAMLFLIPGGGSLRPLDEAMVKEGGHFIKMNGKELFKDAVRRMSAASEDVLRVNHLSHKHVDWFLPHQANLRIIHAVAERFLIDRERILLTLEKYGNTSAASIPIGLDEFLQRDQMKKGETLLIAAFGAGLTFGALILRKV